MREQKPRLNVAVEDDITIVELVDRKILDELSISQIGEQINALVAKSAKPKLLLDFAKVEHMSSSALGMLITLHKRIREKQGLLRLCRVQPAIMEVFNITRLSEIFNISTTRDEALAGLK